MDDKVTLRLVLDVSYVLHGEKPDDMTHFLQMMVGRSIGEGMLTGSTDAEVDEYKSTVTVRPEPLSEDDVANFMLERIENGSLLLEDIPVRLARYGLMEPDDFISEMRERMSSNS